MGSTLRNRWNAAAGPTPTSSVAISKLLQTCPNRTGVPFRGEGVRVGGYRVIFGREFVTESPRPNRAQTLPQFPGCLCDEVPQESVGGDEQNYDAYGAPEEREQPPAPALQNPH